MCVVIIFNSNMLSNTFMYSIKWTKIINNNNKFLEYLCIGLILKIIVQYKPENTSNEFKSH